MILIKLFCIVIIVLMNIKRNKKIYNDEEMIETMSDEHDNTSNEDDFVKVHMEDVISLDDKGLKIIKS